MSDGSVVLRRVRLVLSGARGPGRGGAGGLAVLLGAMLGCGTPQIEKPPAPDMSGLLQSYANPDANFDPADAPEIGLAVAAIDGLLDRTNLREELVDVLQQIIDQADDLSTDAGRSELTIDADGYMLVTRICSGWTEPFGPDRAANGAFLVTATFSHSGLDPIVWGSAETCRYLADGARIELGQTRPNGDAVSVYWGEAVEQDTLAERTLLVRLGLDATIDDESIPLDIDFRSLADGTIEYRIARTDGSLIVRLGADGSATLRAQNGNFSCDADLDCSEMTASNTASPGAPTHERAGP